MEGFDYPRFNMGRQAQATNSVHGLFKSAHSLLLNRIPPAGPLGINPQVSSSYLQRREKTGTPGLLQFVSSVCVPLQMTTRLEHTPIAVTQIMREVRSGRDQDHIVHILAHFDMPSRTLQRADQESM
eukprot:6488937-Amphidinium_carterae.1